MSEIGHETNYKSEQRFTFHQSVTTTTMPW
jgi:hypothetical protein